MIISNEEVKRLLDSVPSARRRMAVSPNRGLTDTPQTAAPESGEALTRAEEMRQIKALVQEMPDIREDRVRLLKEQVEAGTYHVSGEEIADLIIRRILADTTLQ